MGGMGTGPAGYTPAGFDAVQTLGDARVPDAARSLLFDLTTREFPPLADGSLQEVHWVDASVALCIGFELGGIPAAPEKGLDTRRMKRMARATARVTTQNEVRRALGDLLKDGDIALLSVDVTLTSGRVGVELRYVNNRLQTPTRKPTTLRLLPIKNLAA